MKPVSENKNEVKKTMPTVTIRLCMCRSVKNKDMQVTIDPTVKPLITPPITYPNKRTWLGTGDTSTYSIDL